MGIFKSPGERGQTGDHGQTGDEGKRGQPGDTGLTGPRGPAGPSGDTGRRGQTGSRMAKSQLLAYLLIVLTMIYGFWISEQADRRSLEDRCQTREAVRSVYDDVAALGTRLTETSQPPARRQRLRAEIERFREERLAAYPMLPECPQ